MFETSVTNNGGTDFLCNGCSITGLSQDPCNNPCPLGSPYDFCMGKFTRISNLKFSTWSFWRKILVCGGNNNCVGCDLEPWGKKLDLCGDCGGNNSTCLGCDGVPLR